MCPKHSLGAGPGIQEVTGHVFDSCHCVSPFWIITVVDVSSVDTFVLMISRATFLFLNRSLWFILECVHVVLKDKWHLAGSAAFNLFHCSFLFLKMVARTILFHCFSSSSHLRHLFLSAFLLFQTFVFLSAQPNCVSCCTLIFSAASSSQCLAVPGFFQTLLQLD